MEIRKPSETTPLKMGKVSVHINKFSFDKKDYLFDDIKQIYFKSKRDYWNLVGVPNKYAQQFGGHMLSVIELKKSSQEITAKTSTLIEHDSMKLAEFYSGYVYLCTHTFTARYNSYMHEINSFGYFKYAGACFYPDGNIVTSKNAKYNIFESKIIRSPFELTIRPLKKPLGLLGKVKALLGHGLIIPTHTDQDVIYTLLEKLYKIKFK